MSRTLRRRIIRGDGLEAAAASLLIETPVDFGIDGAVDFNGIAEQARREGYEQGYRAATAEIGEAEVAGRAAQLRRVADAIVTAAAEVARVRREAVQLDAAEAADLAFELAGALLQRELSVGRPAYEAVHRALALVPDREDLIVRIHPGDVVDAAEIQQLVPDVAVRVVADQRVEAGGCVVDAGPCRIDAQVGAALGRARHVIDELYGEPRPAAAVEVGA